MDAFIDYIWSTAVLRYTGWHAHNEVIPHTYEFIVVAVRERADTLTITRDHVILGRHGVEKIEEDIGWHERKCRRIKPGEQSLRYTCFRDALALIVEHDQEMRKHLELVEETQERVTYRIVFGDEEEQQSAPS